jgi:hypothetical protein
MRKIKAQSRVRDDLTNAIKTKLNGDLEIIELNCFALVCEGIPYCEH